MLATNKIKKIDVIENCKEILLGFDRQFELLKELAEQDDDNSRVLFTYKLGEDSAVITTLFNLGLISYEKAEELHSILRQIEKERREKS